MGTAPYTEDIPQHYHARLGPLLFEPYAEELARRVARIRPGRVLETACGTGILTSRLPNACADGARIVATDLNEVMIQVARRAVPAGIELSVADMTALPFSDASFDLVASQFGLMFAPDKHMAACEARRVLGSGGAWLLATWAPLERNEVLRLAHETLGELFPANPPRFYETPCSMGEPGPLQSLLERAGFHDARIESVALTGRSETVRSAAIGLVVGTPVAHQIRDRAPARLDEAVEAVRLALERRYGADPLEVDIEALIATAIA